MSVSSSSSILGRSIFRQIFPGPIRHDGRSAMATCLAINFGPANSATTTTSSSATTAGSYPCKFVDISRPDFPEDLSSFSSSNENSVVGGYFLPGGDSDEDVDEVWARLREDAAADVENEPLLHGYYHRAILSHACLESALASYLAGKLGRPDLVPADVLLEVFLDAFLVDQEIGRAIRADLRAVRDRDPACTSMAHCLLYYKGFLACQAHRAAHRHWSTGRRMLALFIQSRVSEVFAVDIHPGARIGKGILLDHATGLVVGETAVIGDDVSILHNVTLGGTGKESGDRHPKIGDGVLVGAGTQILGSVRIGTGAKIGAGSVVLKEVPARTTAVGNPAKLIGGKDNPIKLDKIPSLTMDHTSWSDYVI